MRPGWLVLTLAACVDRSPRTQAAVAPAVVVAPENAVAAAPASPPAASPTVPEAELPSDPPYAPCPAPGWASAEVLIGAWQTGWTEPKAEQQDGIRHDYEADGTLRMLHMIRRGPPDAVRLYGGKLHYVPRPEQRREMLGSWRIDAFGVRELRWVDEATTHGSRGRVWVSVVNENRPHAKLALRPLERGADGAWRGIHRARATAPPIFWQDVIHLGLCAALPAPTD